MLTKLNRKSIDYFITTPIFYVNSKPHVGHVYSVVLADAINRFEKIRSNSQNSIFSTGTDEHGLKVATAADIECLDVKTLCDKNSAKFKTLFNSHDLSLTDFIRTTDLRHKKSVQALWNELVDRNLIYKGDYSGWYCTSDECFVSDAQLKENLIDKNKSHILEDGKEVHWYSEVNYMLKFSKLKEEVGRWLKEKEPIIPKRFNEEAISMIKSMDQSDISVSRPKHRVSWGIDVPNDDDHVIYVWMDALANYLTVADYPCKFESLKRWPIDCQVFGKDILKFHGIIWPALLMSLSLPLPKKLVCHSYWLLNMQKMSKSVGNVVDPTQEAEVLTIEGFRYYLLRAGTPHEDVSYSRAQAIERINSELVNTYANLVGRVSSRRINTDGIIPKNISDLPILNEISELRKRLNDLRWACEKHFDAANFYNGIEEIMTILRLTNKVFEMAKPWTLVELKDGLYYDTMAITYESLRVCSILLQPIVPRLSGLLLDHLNVNPVLRRLSDTDSHLNSGYGDLKLGTDIAGGLMPRLNKDH